jgi:hypothetical protein
VHGCGLPLIVFPVQISTAARVTAIKLQIIDQNDKGTRNVYDRELLDDTLQSSMPADH